MFNISKQAAGCIFDKVDDDFRIFMTNKRTWCHSSGDIDVGDGCSRQDVLLTSLRCWWTIQYIEKNKKSRQHNDSVINILNRSPSKNHQHKVVTNITVTDWLSVSKTGFNVMPEYSNQQGPERLSWTLVLWIWRPFKPEYSTGESPLKAKNGKWTDWRRY